MNTERLCQADNSQLLLIDIQGRLVAAMPEKVSERVIKNAAILAQAALLLEVPVIVSRQYPKGLGDTDETLLGVLAQGKPQDVTQFDKTAFSCCGEACFAQALGSSQRRQIILAGMESHVCVLQTAMDLHAQGYQVFVAEDAICSRNKHHHRNALARLAQNGISICNSESVLFEWLRNADHLQFKAVSALIK